MRISDWSSDVCSSDLAASAPHIWLAFLRADLRRPPAPGRFRVQATCAYSFPQALVIVFRLRQRRTADEKPRPMLAPMARASLAAWPAPVAIAPPPFVTALPNCVTIAAAPPPSEAVIPGIWMKKKQARM